MNSESKNNVHSDIARIVVSKTQIAKRVSELADEISRDFSTNEITLVFALTGALHFASDLVRALPMNIRIQPIAVQSYPNRSVRSQEIQLKLDLTEKLTDRHVIFVDDIFDSGKTADFVAKRILEHNPASLKNCMLLKKNRPDLESRPEICDYFGFEIPDEFVVGYGLDFDGLYRNLPYIGVLAEHAR